MQQPVRQTVTPINQLSEWAIELALTRRWTEAVTVNREIIAMRPNDVGALNRLGNALVEISDREGASRAYQAALDHDPHNPIAARNLASLEGSKKLSGASISSDPSGTIKRAMSTARGILIKTKLVRSAPLNVLQTLLEGEILNIQVSPSGIKLFSPRNEYLGTIFPSLAVRMKRLLAGGNRYAVKVANLVNGDLTVHVIETHRSAKQAHIVSFPPLFAEREAHRVNSDDFDFSNPENKDVEFDLDDALTDENDNEVDKANNSDKEAYVESMGSRETTYDPIYDALK